MAEESLKNKTMKGTGYIACFLHNRRVIGTGTADPLHH